MSSVVLVDIDCQLPLQLLKDIAEAATIFATRDFGASAPNGWGCSAQVRVAPSLSDVQKGEIACCFWSHPSIPNALGFHDTTTSGIPLLHIFPLLDSKDNISVTVTHEIAEFLADPECTATAVGLDGVIRALEPCDAVEATSYTIQVSSGASVKVSNFVFPTYFSPPPSLTGVKLDFLGLVQTPGQILPGGYAIIYNPGTGWVQQTASELRAYRSKILDTSRIARWLKNPAPILE